MKRSIFSGTSDFTILPMALKAGLNSSMRDEFIKWIRNLTIFLLWQIFVRN